MSSQSAQHLPQPSGEDPGSAVQEQVSAMQAAVEDITQNYLETLDALSTVYDAADGFSQLFDSPSIAYFTLRRILESLEVDCGAIFLQVDGVLRFQFESEDALQYLKEGALEDASLEGRALFCNGSDAIRYLHPEAGERNALLAPVVAAQRRLGIVVVFSERGRPFTTKDLKLAAAVTSQAAIALGGAQHMEQILIERQKLRSVIEDNGGGIVVLAPDGRTMLTNAVARELLGFPDDRAEGFSLLDELAHWKFSREPESLCGDGPTELTLEMATGSGAQQRVLSVAGRRVRGTDGELASVVLNLQDATEKRRGERMREDFLSQVSMAFRVPIETMRDRLHAVGTVEDEEQRNCQAFVSHQLDELVTLTDRLRCYVEVLDSSWSGKGVADLGQVVAESRAWALEQHGDRSPQVELEVDATAPPAGISTECARIVVDNLLENAIEFGSQEQPVAWISVHAGAEGWTSLTVEDRLGTVPAGVQQRFIHGFGSSSDDQAGEAAGLTVRLALVQEAVQRVGGRIEASPSPEGGTLLTVNVPSAMGSLAPGDR